MTKTLKDYLLKGGIEGVWFEDSNKEEDKKTFPSPITYQGIYTIVNFSSSRYHAETLMRILDQSGQEATFNLAHRLNDKEYNKSTKSPQYHLPSVPVEPENGVIFPREEEPTYKPIQQNAQEKALDNQIERLCKSSGPLKINDPHLREPYTPVYNLDIDNAD